MLNIVVPMAGLGSRFSRAGYAAPKPLIDIDGQPMIEVVIRNLTPATAHRFIFICQRQHLEQYNLANVLAAAAPNSIVIPINEVTEGAACTVLLATNYINNADPLMIANCDQYIDVDINDYLNWMDQKQLDGLIMTLTSNDPKWSFVGFDANNRINRVVEKQVISSEATVGIYNFKHGQDFVNAAQTMIHNNERVNGEFYVAPVYNGLIEQGKTLGVYNIGEEGRGMHGLGIPEDLQLFLQSDILQKLRGETC